MLTPLGDVIGRMKVKLEHPEDDDVIDNDLILVWGNEKRIILPERIFWDGFCVGK